MNNTLNLLALLVLSGIPSLGTEPVEETHVSPQVLASRVQPSLVMVAYELKSDNGEYPAGSAGGERCPNCGNFHGNSLSDAVTNRKPVLVPGILLSDRLVITADTEIPDRFIQSVTVSNSAQTAQASGKVTSLQTDGPGCLIELHSSIAESTPLEFRDPIPAKPYSVVHVSVDNRNLQTSITPVAASVHFPNNEEAFCSVPHPSVIVDQEGNPAGVTLSGKLALDESWKGSPINWNWQSGEGTLVIDEALTKTIETNFVTISLLFRNPEVGSELEDRRYGRSEDAMIDPATVETQVMGIAIAPNRILIPRGMDHPLTSRLEQIQIIRKAGDPIKASFVGNLRDYLAFLIEPELPFENPIEVDFSPIESMKNKLIQGSEITLMSDFPRGKIQHFRISDLDFDDQNRLIPDFETASTEDLFLFANGKLMAIPLSNRPIPLLDDRSYASNTLTPCAYLKSVIVDPNAQIMRDNVPGKPGDPVFSGWIGVELQPLDYELAKLHGLMYETNQGETGALITHVHPESPAAKAGVRSGDVILRIYETGTRVPTNLDLGYYPENPGNFDWSILDQIPEEYYERLPAPWAIQSNPFDQLLTALGNGTLLGLDLKREQEVLQIEVPIESSPINYANAPRVHLATLGLTVRDLTYEVRAFMTLGDEEQGVVVSRVEPASRASVAGVRPFEMITHVNGESASDSSRFAELMKSDGPKVITVQRMGQQRLVRIQE